jgi:hypothetical protein
VAFFEIGQSKHVESGKSGFSPPTSQKHLFTGFTFFLRAEVLLGYADYAICVTRIHICLAFSFLYGK